MDKIKILVTFDLPDAFLKRIEALSPRLEVEKSNKERELIQLIENTDILFAGFFSLEMFLKAQN